MRLEELNKVPAKSARNNFHIKVASTQPEREVQGWIDSIVVNHGERELLALMIKPDKRDVTPYNSLVSSPNKLSYVIDKLGDDAHNLFRSQNSTVNLGSFGSDKDRINLLDKIWDIITASNQMEQGLKYALQSKMISVVKDTLKHNHENYTKDFVNKVLESNNTGLKYRLLLLPLLKQFGQDDDVVKRCIQKCKTEAGFWYRLKLFFNGYFKLAINWDRVTLLAIAPSQAVDRGESSEDITPRNADGVVRPGEPRPSPPLGERNGPE